MSPVISLTTSLYVDLHDGTVHIALSQHLPDGEFLTQSLLVTPAVARDLAAALNQLADEHNVNEDLRVAAS